MEGQHYPLSPRTYSLEATVIRKRVRRRLQKGEPVTSDMVWAWIKERHPTWSEQDQEQVFQKVSMH